MVCLENVCFEKCVCMLATTTVGFLSIIKTCFSILQIVGGDEEITDTTSHNSYMFADKQHLQILKKVKQNIESLNPPHPKTVKKEKSKGLNSYKNIVI